MELDQPLSKQPRRIVLPVAVTARMLSWRTPVLGFGAALLVAGCSSGNSNQSPDATNSSPLAVSSSAFPTNSLSSPFESLSAVPSMPDATSPSSTETATDNCETPYFPVQPRLHFKLSNLDDLEKQRNALAIAQDLSQAITADDIQQATAIVVDAGSDPVYAHAFLALRDNPNLPDLDQMVADNYSALESQDCLTDAQVAETQALFTTLKDGLGPRVKQFASLEIKTLYLGLVHAFDRLQTYAEKH